MSIEVQPRQWLIAEAGVVARGRTVLALAGWQVVLGEDAACILIADARGRPVGCLLGEPIDVAGGRFLSSPARLPFAIADCDPAKLESWLATLGGAFTAFIATPGLARVYPSASRSCVWREDARLVASAPLSLLSQEDYAARLDRDLVAAMEIEGPGWLPAGLTAHRGVRRLLPNHHLDLATFLPARHWAGPDAGTVGPGAAVARIGAIMSTSMSAVATRYRPRLALTAGRDSRAVLAACRGLADKIGAFTIGHDTAGPDREIPVEICASSGIAHRLIGQRVSTEAERRRWLELSGHCVGGSNLRLHRSVGCFGADEAVVTGAAGEVGRGFYWNSGDTPATPLTAQSLIARMDLKQHPAVVAAVASWLEGVAHLDTLRILDLAYIELRLGCWASPQAHGFPEASFHFAPLDHREIFAALMSLPPQWRRSGSYIDVLISGLWPELARWPFNRFGGLRQAVHMLGKLGSWERIRRKLRRHVLARA